MPRRGFLRAGSACLLGLGVTSVGGPKAMGAFDKTKPEANCIFLMLVGGPSQLDTWDMKPGACTEIRGPYKPIKTNVPGIEISEIFPRMSKIADKFAIVRSMYHDAFPTHEVSRQTVQTGRPFVDGIEYPHFGGVVSTLIGRRGDAPAYVLLPQAAPSQTDAHHSYCAREAYDLRRESRAIREKYGLNRFGENCLRARRLIEAGVRFVTVNMFDSVFNEITWDIHGSKPFSPISCYSDYVGPMFDMAYSALLTELSERGLLQNTMVVATGEFGRTPKINVAGGRDHWPQCWSLLAAGGGIRGGQIIGSSDGTGAEPRDRPTSTGEIAATIYHGFGIHPGTHLHDSQGRTMALLEHGIQPVHELFT